MSELTPLQPVQVMTFSLSIGLLVGTLVWAYYEQRGGMLLYLVAPMTFAVHIVLFYGVVILRELGQISTGPLTLWSAYLRLHGMFTMFSLVLMIIFRCSRLARGR